MTASNPPLTFPVIDLSSEQSGFDQSILREAIARGGPGFFPRQRWFGDKARVVASASLADVSIAVVQSDQPNRFALTIVEIAFEDGGRERYFLPLALVDSGEATNRTLAQLNRPDTGDVTQLEDALEIPEFHVWLLDPVADPAWPHGVSNGIHWRPGPHYASAIDRTDTSSSRLSRAEQSNSAVIYGHGLLAKVFRKLRPGLNPDIEIGRFLSEQTNFRQFPELLADLSYESSDDRMFSIAMTLPLVPNVGDAWDYFQSRLGDMLRATAVDLDLVAPFRRLGQRTGQLHEALATPTLDPAFAAEKITNADVRGWVSALESALDRTLTSLRGRADVLSPSARAALAGLSAESSSMVDRISAFQALEGVAKIRVHGDYHLGQTLVTPDEDFVIIDFEGEPSRPMNERRAKTSPLKDVAGMVRSISYARAAALRSRPDEIPIEEAENRLLEWETDARDAFLGGYREATADRGATFLPRDPAAFDAALAAWELDKAVYEVNYELNNRPDWLSLPLGALLGAPVGP